MSRVNLNSILAIEARRKAEQEEKEAVYREYKSLPSGSMASRSYWIAGANYQKQMERMREFLK